jgi:hypothetical protein
MILVAGYWILQVMSMDEAIEWAKRLPFEAGGEPGVEGEIEIRQLFEPSRRRRPCSWNAIRARTRGR